jgi:hypothetical protein
MNVKIFKCFIASPGDTAEERKICDEVFDTINKTIGQNYNFRIESKKWEDNARPSFGTDGQDVINNQLLKDYDLFIGIMWSRFGAPTPRAGSGTEEEFDQAFKERQEHKEIEILFYFNTANPDFESIDPDQLLKVRNFRRKLSDLGGLYKKYIGPEDFREKLFHDLHSYFSSILSKSTTTNQANNTEEEGLSKTKTTKILQQRLDDSLRLFANQPAIWVEPVISKKESISEKSTESYNSRVRPEELIRNPYSAIIKAPPQFGLTCLANYLALEAWNTGSNWIILNAKTVRRDEIKRHVNKELIQLGLDTNKTVDCIILDSWKNTEHGSKKLLKNLCYEYPQTPIIVMQTTEDSPFLQEESSETINREFKTLYLLALPRNQVRKVVAGYNDARNIGDENILLGKVLREIEALNIHRTPLNCITLLKVSESNFGDSPVNRTKMIEMILFALFNLYEIPTYKSKPDLKDCEYALGRFCETLIRSRRQIFTREEFLEELEMFCKEKLLNLEVSIVFDTLYNNNIITKINNEFCFRATYWIYYFAARRMYASAAFRDYIINKESYASFPEIIEFYTGIDRDRGELLEKLTQDLSKACDTVDAKTGLQNSQNPLSMIEWNPDEESLNEAKRLIHENVAVSKLPESLKDEYADKNYNPLKPYDQRIQYIIEDYCFSALFKKIKASSRALRNSDYVDPDIKRNLLGQIVRGWRQVSQILFALTPLLASKGEASFEGQGFILDGNFGESFETKIKTILLANPYNVVKIFKDDL